MSVLVYFCWVPVPAIVILILYLIDIVYKREYKKTIKRCTYHVIGKVSENNYDYTAEYNRRSGYHYRIILKYIFTINGVKYEKASTWKMRTRGFGLLE